MIQHKIIFFLRSRKTLVFLVIVVLGGIFIRETLMVPSFHFETELHSLVSPFVGLVGSDEDWQLVRRVVDGDTIELENGSRVRYIGMNTPETVNPNAPLECFGREASKYNKQLVEGKWVRLERDVSDRDRYGRLLRFVYLEDGTFVNEALVRNGYAYVSTFPPDIAQESLFRQAEVEAKSNKRGLWADDTCHGRK